MAGSIIENLSGRKLCILVVLLLFGLITCFLLGGIIAPKPSSYQTVLGTICVDKEYHKSKNYLARGRNRCNSVESLNTEDNELTRHKLEGVTGNHIIFVFQIPLKKEGIQLDFSRWQQNLLAMMMIEFAHDNNQHFNPDMVLTIDAKISYRNKWDADDDWKVLSQSVEERTLNCVENEDEYESTCSPIPILELGSLHHDFYLLNIRFPNYLPSYNKSLNDHLIRFDDVSMVFIHQNGGFTKVWMSLKSIFFPIIISIMAWFWHRLSKLSRPAALLEYMLTVLGAALTFLNLPVEYLTLFVECPWMLLFTDLRQGIFYAALLSFWLIFAGEHLMDDVERNRIRSYWKHLSAVILGCFCLFIFDVCERGIQLNNPFASIWSSDIGTKFALTFIIVAGICAGLYFIFLCYLIYRVFMNISSKRNSLPAMATSRRMKYEGIIYRFKILMLATLLCAAVTVLAFIIGQASEGQQLEDAEPIEYNSAFLTGVYGMWNIYTFALICLYAPSHKKWPNDTDNQSSTGEEIEFNRLMAEPSELSSLTSLAQKTSID